MNKIVLFDIDYTLFNTDIFKKSNLQEFSLYPEVPGVLQELGKVVKLGIFSEGDISLQKRKLLETKIGIHFMEEHVNIIASKEEELPKILQKYNNHELFLVDDKLTILHRAKIIMPSLYTIWVRRGVYADNQTPIEGFLPDAEVDNLQQILEVIKGE